MEKELHTLGAWKIPCDRSWSWESDDNKWEGYHFWYVCEGVVTVKTKTEEYHLVAGDAFLFDLSENHSCTHDLNHLLTHYGIYFRSNQLRPEQIQHKHLKNVPLLGEMMKHCVTLFRQRRNQTLDCWVKTILTEFTNEEEPYQTHPVILVLQRAFQQKTRKMFSLEQMCQATGYSKNHLIRIVTQETGFTPLHYQMYYKMEYAKSRLWESDDSIGAIGEQLGFVDSNYFTKVFRRYTGYSPRDFRRMQ